MRVNYFPFNIDDYLADTGHLSTCEHGAYLMLILYYWKHGGLPTDDRRLRCITKADWNQWKRIRPVLQAFFDENWRHKRIEHDMLDLQKRLSKKTTKRSKADPQQPELGFEQAGQELSPGTLSKNSHFSTNPLINHDPPAENSSKPLETIGKSLSPNGEKTPQSVLAADAVKLTRVKRVEEAEEFFEKEIWPNYPRREGSNPKAPARSKFVKAVVDSGVPREAILAGVRRYARATIHTEPRFVAQTVTWMNQRRWEDHDLPTKPPPSNISEIDQLYDTLKNRGTDGHPASATDDAIAARSYAGAGASTIDLQVVR